MANYARFLGAWYNLVFLALIAAGLLASLGGRYSGRDTLRISTALLVAGVTGLTVNGALHDLGLAGYASRFPWVLGVSVLAGLAGADLRMRLRRAWSSRNRGVPAFLTVEGLEGERGEVSPGGVGPPPRGGRAAWRDKNGAVRLVRIHTAGERLAPGAGIRFVAFDRSRLSYLVTSDEPGKTEVRAADRSGQR